MEPSRSSPSDRASYFDRFRQALRASIDEAVQMLDSRPVASSDAWFELSERLRRDTWRVNSAAYCLHEWVESHDENADSDPVDNELTAAERARRKSRRAGRRNLRLWQDNDA